MSSLWRGQSASLFPKLGDIPSLDGSHNVFDRTTPFSTRMACSWGTFRAKLLGVGVKQELDARHQAVFSLALETSFRSMDL